jgi:hypothetical protein
MSCGLLPWWRARHRFLPTAEDLDDAHGPAATGAWLTQGEWGDLWLRGPRRRLFRGLHTEQRTDFGKSCLAATTGNVPKNVEILI